MGVLLLRDRSTEMSRLHLGIVISEKGGSLVQFLQLCLCFLGDPGLPLTGPKAHHREISPLSSLSCLKPPSSQP